MAVELNGKRLELMREVLPHLRTAAIMGDPGHAGMDLERGDFEAMGRQLDVEILHFPTRNLDDVRAAMAEMERKRPQAISLLADGFSLQNRQRIIDAATSLRVPVFSGWAVFARSGSLCSYGPNHAVVYRRLAHYVDRVLKGARPAELPIERPTHFELVVNLVAARALGIVVPPALVGRADEVIR
jgi:putative ABC transport system substrate-binding protein